jgi:hypothetical protein
LTWYWYKLASFLHTNDPEHPVTRVHAELTHSLDYACEIAWDGQANPAEFPYEALALDSVPLAKAGTLA